MRKTLWMALICVLCVPVWGRRAAAAEPNAPAAAVRPPHDAKAVVIPCTGMIDDALFYSIRRRTETALRGGANYLIYEISTYGGLVDAADSIAKYLIQKVAPRGHTVAYVATEAISAGALISVSCRDIVMQENTTIGDAAPITMGGKLEGVEREKAESFMRAAFQRAAEANGYPPLLLKAMVTIQLEAYRVRNLDTGGYEFFEGDNLPKDPNKYDLKGAEKVVGKDQLLTLTAPRAQEFGIARAVVKDHAGALAFLAKRDGVVFREEPRVLQTSWSERMVSWVNSPGVMAVLVMLALLGVYVEFSTPGFGLAGIVAVICFVIIIGSKYLVGMANWVEILLLLVGLVLLFVEVFVLPGFGIAGVLGIMCVLFGLFGMLVRNAPNELPWPQTTMDWQSVSSGVLSLAIGFGGFAVLAYYLSQYLPKLGFMRGLMLTPNTTTSVDEQHNSTTAPPQDAGVPVRIGAIGTVTTKLRPAGKARFGAALVDVVATGEFLDVGTQVEIIAINGSRVVVKEATGGAA
jgi:membrane-bound serine protease (ClpP class)